MKLMSNRKFERVLYSVRREARQEGIEYIVDLVRDADKIYTEPITITGDGTRIERSVFIGNPEGSSCVTIERVNPVK